MTKNEQATFNHFSQTYFHKNINPYPQNRQEGFNIEELTAYIVKNISEPNLSVDNISRQLGISRTQVYRKLAVYIPMPIAEYIRYIRLEMAVELLKSTKVTIAEVAYLTGFSSPSHFSRTFKQVYGFTPSQWQQS